MVNTPNRRAFFRRAALLCLEIHKVFLRQIALPGEKILAAGHIANFQTAPSLLHEKAV